MQVPERSTPPFELPGDTPRPGVPGEGERAPSPVELRARATIAVHHLVTAPTSLEGFVQQVADAVGSRLEVVVVVFELHRPGGPTVTSRPPDGPEPVVNLASVARDGTQVALRLYCGGTPTRQAVELAEVYLSVIARVVHLRLRLDDQETVNADLRAAAASRSMIDQAMGVMMLQNRCSAPEAFAILRQASQNRGLKLRDVAAAILDGVSDEASVAVTTGPVDTPGPRPSPGSHRTPGT